MFLSGDDAYQNNIQFCDECEIHYNGNEPHECNLKNIRANRRKLESWLGKFSIKEE